MDQYKQSAGRKKTRETFEVLKCISQLVDPHSESKKSASGI